MYETHFGFHRQPFQASDAVRAFFESQSTQAAIPLLRHAMRFDPGVAILTGPAGVGKSCLLKLLQQKLLLDGRAFLCSAASLDSPAALLESLLAASRQPDGQSESASLTPCRATPSHWTVREKLQRSAQFWGPVLLLVDDAHLLPPAVVNELRAFIDDSTEVGPLLRTIISGPMQLEEELTRATYAEFGRRVRCHVLLEPLTMIEAARYLRHQIEQVGGHLEDVFERAAVEQLLQAADGSPRCINLLADETLVEAARRTLPRASADCVQHALGRLIHLPYEWNISVSPMTSEEFGTRDSGSASLNPAPHRPEKFGESGSKDVSGVIEFGEVATTGSVVEFGAPEASPEKAVSATAVEFGAPLDASTDASEPDAEAESVTANEIHSPEPLVDAVPPEPAAIAEPAGAEPIDADDEGDTFCPAFEVGFTFGCDDIGDAEAVPDEVDQTVTARLGDSPATDPTQTPCEVPALSSWVRDTLPVEDRYTWLSLGRLPAIDRKRTSTRPVPVPVANLWAAPNVIHRAGPAQPIGIRACSDTEFDELLNAARPAAVPMTVQTPPTARTNAPHADDICRNEDDGALIFRMPQTAAAGQCADSGNLEGTAELPHSECADPDAAGTVVVESAEVTEAADGFDGTDSDSAGSGEDETELAGESDAAADATSVEDLTSANAAKTKSAWPEYSEDEADLEAVTEAARRLLGLDGLLPSDSNSRRSRSGEEGARDGVAGRPRTGNTDPQANSVVPARDPHAIVVDGRHAVSAPGASPATEDGPRFDRLFSDLRRRRDGASAS